MTTTKNMDRVAFIHIPKCAGSYIGQVRGRMQDAPAAVLRPMTYCAHALIVKDVKDPICNEIEWNYRLREKDIEGMSVLAVVRNPFDLLVSFYEMQKRDGVPTPFREALEFYARRPRMDNVQYGREFLFAQLFSTSGRLIVDYIARQETLGADLDNVARLWNLERHGGEARNVGKHQSYRTYYNEDLRAVVERTWGRELKLFGYSFSGLDDKTALLPRGISPSIRDRWRYNMATDELFDNGKLVERHD